MIWMSAFIGMGQDDLGAARFDRLENSEGEFFQRKGNALIGEAEIVDRGWEYTGECKSGFGLCNARRSIRFAASESGIQRV